jgi:hypothetical protein
MKCRSCNAFMNPLWETCLVCEKVVAGPIDKVKATELYKTRGWIEIFSTLLDTKIYLVRDDKVKTPDTGILRYAQSELDDLRDLSLEERKSMHEAKKIFGGVISKGR